MNFKIVILGERNVGKSTLMNLLAGQQVSIVSPTPGTTTDPVRKRMEVPGTGICTFVDTAGIDDTGELGEKRVKTSLAEARSADLILMIGTPELPEVSKFESKTIHISEFDREKIIHEISKRLADAGEPTILDGLVRENDRIVLVCPVDIEAPEGRLILPQVAAIRDILDHGGIAEVLQPSQLRQFISRSDAVSLVVTDSQAFKTVSEIVPEAIPLTSFSLLLARSKGPFKEYINGVAAIDRLKEGDRILILESCTHHASCDDIGRVKIPRLLMKYAGCSLEFDFVSGLDAFDDGCKHYALAIQCGGCMVARSELSWRICRLIESGVPVTNYGMAIAYVNGIFSRAVKPLL